MIDIMSLLQHYNPNGGSNFGSYGSDPYSRPTQGYQASSGFNSYDAPSQGYASQQANFNSKDPQDYYKQIPGAVQPYLQPYMNAGSRGLSELDPQFHQLVTDPASRLNQIGAGYQQSPGFQFALKQALASGANAAAAGGMRGTAADQQNAMQTATGLENQDYNTYLQHALGLYGQGLQGYQDFAHMGQQSSTDMGQLIAESLAQQAAAKQHQNDQRNAFWTDLFKTAGGVLAGPIGGGLGNLISKKA